MDKEVSGVYICDLLSFAMGGASAGSAWITIMSNINVIAVAHLRNVACVVIAHGVQIEQKVVEKANELALPIFLSSLPAFECGQAIAKKQALG